MKHNLSEYSLIPSFVTLRKSHVPLNLRDCQPRIQPLRTRPRAIKNSVAPIQTHAIIQRLLSFSLLLISRVGDPPVALKENGGTEILLAVPPIAGTGGAAAGAEDAFVEAVEFAAVGGGLAVFAALRIISVTAEAYHVTVTYIRRWSVTLEIRLDRPILLVEQGKIRDKVLHDIGMRQWVNPALLAGIRGNTTETGEGIDTVDIHCAAPADALSARPPERKSRIDLILDPDQSVEHHGSGPVEVEGVGLHPRF